MIWKEVRHKLDMQAIVSLSMDPKQEGITRDSGVVAPCLLNVSEKKVTVTSYFPSQADNSRVQAAILSLNPKKGKDIMAVTTSNVTSAFEKFIKSAINIESVVVGKHFVGDGMTHFSIRFHHLHQGIVSDLLMDVSDSPEFSKVEYFGPTLEMNDIGIPGMESLGVEVLSLHSEPPESELNAQSNPMGDSWSREIRYHPSDDFIDSVSYIDGETQTTGKCTAINKNAGIYRCVTHNDLLRFLWEVGTEKKIYHSRSVQKLHNGQFDVEMIFPSPLNASIMSLVNAARKKFPEWKIYIQNLYRIDAGGRD
ncbi:MAG: hypothetical protein M1151_06910 [Candidatus Thermoplasmatota archaeon]|nr:hypothetical protein [Candidatus Thermoplasmatota archaeon]